MAITINVNLDEILAALKNDLDFTGNADKYIKVNATADGFEFAAVTAPTWGSITGTLSDQTDLQTALDGKLAAAVSINTQTASYTLVLADANKLVRMNVASANNLTIPPNSSVAFGVGTVLYVEQMGAGTTTVVAGSGVTINTTALKTPYQYGTITLIQVSADVWNVIGGTV